VEEGDIVDIVGKLDIVVVECSVGVVVAAVDCSKHPLQWDTAH